MKQLLYLLPLCALAGCYYHEPYHSSYRETVIVDDGPMVVHEYYYVDGRYYYWHPGYSQYVIYEGVPRRECIVYRDRPLPVRHPTYGPNPPPVRRVAPARQTVVRHEQHR